MQSYGSVSVRIRYISVYDCVSTCVGLGVIVMICGYECGVCAV